MAVRAWLVALVALGGLAGCGSDEPAGGPLTGPVVVTREGGVGGIAERLTVEPGGATSFRGKGSGDPARTATGEATPAELRALEAALADWSDTDEDQTTDGTASDLIVTTVGYDGHAVRSDDGTDPDDDLARVLDAVEPLEP